ncbi:MAG: tripartite tricarboxylate transporter receptor family protein [Achromobacter mucicolens]|jgi:tripartite-type tricarboxylate transporter receptor subunit TctC|uniref:Bug family tripartite tricarboxylate transporter substrate binding protein n=1 Tax=Achromobacter mucicolens TaxID=1389922 RepID=UPI00242DC901|nr:tripartite tricarboxylate transporter substrate-binding protein [Achromobacter mucicolens]MDF2862063.1 tripartite tricarboxylate transporter receptor family protein [Achromobacter mucicolens]MDH1520989.1 tripartite tricarboxylate transporter substrate-binding protein [Achromobacter mucicolens]
MQQPQHPLNPARRRLLQGAAAGVALTLAGAARAADAYPAKPVTIIVPYAPGGQGDVFARILAERLGTEFKQTFIVENRPGASGAVGSRIVLRAPADGYTLLLGQTGEIAVNPYAMKSLGYDPLREFAPVILVGDSPLVLVVPEKSPHADLAALIAAARAKPDAIAYASSGTATPGHLAAAALALGTQTRMIHAPYKGAGQAMSDLLGGHVDCFFSSASAAMPHINSGRLRALAVSSRERLGILPKVPTISEAAVPDFQFSLWGGVFAPAQTPLAVVEQLNAKLNAILAEPAIKSRLEGDGAAVRPNTSQEFTAFVRSEAAKYQNLVQATGVQVE